MMGIGIPITLLHNAGWELRFPPFEPGRDRKFTRRPTREPSPQGGTLCVARWAAEFFTGSCKRPSSLPNLQASWLHPAGIGLLRVRLHLCALFGLMASYE
jgi:hypothetical protein